MYSLALTINTNGPLGASTYTVVRARLRLNTRGQPGIPTRSFSLCALPAPRQIHDAGRPSHVLPMAIHRSVHEAKGAGCGRLPGTVVAPYCGHQAVPDYETLACGCSARGFRQGNVARAQTKTGVFRTLDLGTP